MSKVTVVIPNWNGIDLIRECLDSLSTQTSKHHIIVVDNGSVDGSNEVVRREYPEVELLEFPNNAGFAGGVNRGIRPALEQNADYIALFNNDAVADSRWLEHLLEAAEADDRIGAVASKIVTNSGVLDSTGDFYSIWGFPFPRGRGEADRGQYDGAHQGTILAASGGASLYRADMFREIGLFDERFFAYYEDTDIGLRGWLAGWQMRYEPAAVVRHYVGGTSSRIDTYGQDSVLPEASLADRPSKFARYHSVKNFSYVYTKNMPGWLYWKYLPLFWTSWLLMIGSDLKRGLIVSNIKANFTALLNFPAMLAARRRIQRRRQSSLREIDRLLYHHLPPLQKKRFRLRQPSDNL